MGTAGGSGLCRTYADTDRTRDSPTWVKSTSFSRVCSGPPPAYFMYLRSVAYCPLRHCDNTNYIFCIEPKIARHCSSFLCPAGKERLIPCPSAASSLHQSRHESLHAVCPDHAWTRESLPAPPGRSELSFLEAAGLNHSGWQLPWAFFHCSLIMRWPDSKPQLLLERHGMTSPSHSLQGPDPRAASF